MYMMFKHLHYLVVSLSAIVLTIQFVAHYFDLAIKDKKWLKIVPHILYTLILLTALGLLGTLKLNPFEHTWVMHKILGFVCYVALGALAYKYARNNGMRMLGYIGAIAWLLITVNIAITKTPLF